MAVTNTTTTAAYVFKTNYASRIYDTAMRVHPTLSMVEAVTPAGHDGEFVGSSFTYPMKFGNPQGVSNSFSNAQGQASVTRGVQFAAIATTKYGTVLVDGPSILKCADDGAFVDLVTITTDDTINAHMNMLAFDLFRSSSGIRGQISVISTNTISFVTPDDARNFEIDQTIGASPNSNGTSPRTGSTTVTAVNLGAGQITVASAAAITSLQVGDFLFNNGDPAGQGTSLGSWNGMEDSTPLIAPVNGDSFRGQDRSIYVERLSGSRLAASVSQGQTIEESVGQAAILVNTVGGMTNTAVLNPINFWAVARRGNARVEMGAAGGELKYGFETALISTPAGTLRIVSDPDCPTNRCRGFDKESHYIRRNKELVHVINDDGNYNLRSTTADSLETRTRTLANYIQNNTRNHFVFAI
jgi:hypothetical protein